MILLQNGFDLPEIKERNLKGRKKGTGNLGEYHPDSKIIYINNHPIIKEMGGLRKIMQNEVVKGRAVQDNVVLHELAHYIDQIINPGFDSPQHSYRVFLNREYVKEQLSEYAYTNRSEFEAELISGILRGKVYPKEILDYADISKLDNEKAKHILALGNGTIPNDSGLPREFDKMTETVYKNPEKDAAVLLTDSDVRKFIERQKLIFDNAVDTALKEVPLDDISVQRLKESNYVFSGIKTFHELNEAFPSLLDEEGNRKPFNQFLNDVQKVYDAYNVQYLRTEYNFAQASALMAARWKKFEQDGDRYNLQYRTMYDKRVRRTHRMLHNITLPIESPFWDKYFPPNGWNCRCTVVQVRKDKYTVSNEQEAMNLGSQATAGKYQEMFMFNPGKRMTTFPAYNGYTLRKCNRCEVRPDKMKLAADIPDNEVCRACRLLQEYRHMDAKATRHKAAFLKGTKISHPEFSREIEITGKSIKEWTNQPFKHFYEKNRMLLDIENAIKETSYLGAVPYHKSDDVKWSHIFETEIQGSKAWIIVREYTWGDITLHSISDSMGEYLKEHKPIKKE
ncbi:phage minor head protein [Phocaeicola plebeius]|uniref:phage minor head protein n=1 Tax=Phocaeicola plebeius TaxID=310297 RepID=UPI0026ED6952|nr:phage minor head protein [Phocaeicola plebeius]